MELLFDSFIPIDRRHALARGLTLPDPTVGAALFADISGFTPLTEALAKDLGPKRGIEELTKLLDIIYGALIAEVHRFHGTVINFSGDAITCWFDDEGQAGAGVVGAGACALAMQNVMGQFATVSTPSGVAVSLAIKVALAAGPARRFCVGDPQVQYIDVLAGATLDQLAATEHLASRGEILAAETAISAGAGRFRVLEWRPDEAGLRAALVGGLDGGVDARPWPDLPAEALGEAVVRPWLLPGIYQRIRAGQDRFIAELRTAVALFMRFGGLDYEADAAAGEKLGAYICWVQHIATRYDGSLLQLTIGDKGSYLYVAFGAPVAHEDDVTRAALAALELRTPPRELDFIRSVQIGISQGRMRVGPYGSRERRTFGVLGDHVNLAARLMQNAAPGEVLVSLAAQKDAVETFEWEERPALRVKGKSEPVAILQLIGAREQRGARLHEPRYALPIVGREAELAVASQRLEQTLAGHGQLLAITAEAGMGKSRLVAEIMRVAAEQGLVRYVGEAESFGAYHSYLAWQSVWRDFFALNPDQSPEEQTRQLETQLGAVDPALPQRLPLLGAVLNLPLADNELTASLEAKVRKASLEALLVDCLRARAQATPMLLVVEDCHWLDALSLDLVEEIGRATADIRVMIVLTYRPPDPDRSPAPRAASLPHSTSIALTDFTPAEAERLIRLKLEKLGASGGLSPAFINRITDRAQGNPFYIEELINYLHDLGFEPGDQKMLEQVDLPNSLQSLVLSRVDQLDETQKITIKVATIIGRQFRRAWLWGVDPQIGEPARVRADLEALSRLDLTPLDQPEPEAIYLFKHVITRDVAYESLPFSTRTVLHGSLARYVEQTYAGALDPFVDLLAYHYGLSADEPKKREYLRRAGEAAQATYANTAAIDYYRRLLPLLPQPDRAPVIYRLAQVLELVGTWGEAADMYRQALDLAVRHAQRDQALAGQCERAIGLLMRKQGNPGEALDWLNQAQRKFEQLGDQSGVVQILADTGEILRLLGRYDLARQSYDESLVRAESALESRPLLAARANALKGAGTLANQQGNSTRARQLYEESLAVRRQLDDRWGVAVLLNNLGMVAMFQDDNQAAQPLFAESLGHFREIGDRWAMGQLENNLGLVTRYLGQVDEARALLEESVAVRRALGDKWGIANSLSSLTNLLIHQGIFEGVREQIAESLALNQEVGDRTAIAYCLEDFAGLAAGQGQAARALTLASAAAALREAVGSPLPPGEQAALYRVLEPARRALDEASQAAAGQRGRTLTTEQAVQYTGAGD